MKFFMNLGHRLCVTAHRSRIFIATYAFLARFTRVCSLRIEEFRLRRPSFSATFKAVSDSSPRYLLFVLAAGRAHVLLANRRSRCRKAFDLATSEHAVHSHAEKEDEYETLAPSQNVDCAYFTPPRWTTA
jgi:hypothetical protein